MAMFCDERGSFLCSFTANPAPARRTGKAHREGAFEWPERYALVTCATTAHGREVQLNICTRILGGLDVPRYPDTRSILGRSKPSTGRRSLLASRLRVSCLHNTWNGFGAQFFMTPRAARLLSNDAKKIFCAVV